MKILVTGAAGFIGFHSCIELCRQGHSVVGLDNMNDYYDVRLKYARLNQLNKCGEQFKFSQIDLADSAAISRVFRDENFDKVLHLGAQAGVRYSIENPHAYVQSNITGTLNILEACRAQGVRDLIYASSSSVYGLNRKVPFSENDITDSPISLYAATKKSNELMCQTYSHLYGLRCFGLRFFTVYGPWGRPDMAYFKFTKSILNGSPIDVYNAGDMSRDFTYIDDIVSGISSLVNLETNQKNSVFHKIYNLGNSSPERLQVLIQTLEDLLGMKAQTVMLPMQPGDVQSTFADISEARNDFGYDPKTTLQQGLKSFSTWYLANQKNL